jgi:type II secretory pathway pseudopilin PulG
MVELLMVIAIIGVATAIAMPRWTRSVARYEADAAARRLAADLAWAQSMARNTSTSLTVHFNISDSSYQLVGVADPDHPNKGYSVDLKQPPYRCTIVASSASDANGNIVFDGYGATTSAGSIVLQAGEAQKQVTVNGGNGGATISQ